jgi:hypothetical protein
MCHVGTTTIGMNQISRNAKFGYWVLEHGNLPLKEEVPVFMRDDRASCGCKQRQTRRDRECMYPVNVCIQVGVMISHF